MLTACDEKDWAPASVAVHTGGIEPNDVSNWMKKSVQGISGPEP